ncbi:hypothetical protein PENTCL1PPCAC_8964, partial [Pristionchus entomophagus]
AKYLGEEDTFVIKELQQVNEDHITALNADWDAPSRISWWSKAAGQDDFKEESRKLRTRRRILSEMQELFEISVIMRTVPPLEERRPWNYDFELACYKQHAEDQARAKCDTIQRRIMELREQVEMLNRVSFL